MFPAVRYALFFCARWVLSVTFIFSLLLSGKLYAYPPFQLYVELTPAGGVLRPEAGRYSGPVVLTKPITIEGRGEVIIDAEGEGSVITVAANGTVLRGLHITNSGDSFDDANAGITLKADNTLIENNRIDDVLFGVNVLGSNDNIIRDNKFSSKDTLLSQRGDGLRMWNSHDNLIENNEFFKVRDLYITNSLTNRFVGNLIHQSRIGFELVFSHENEIIGNTIKNNATGLMIVYSNYLTIKKNQIRDLRKISGSAMALKESNAVQILDNEILNCSVGISANAPLDPENILTIQNNQFAYNDIALYFYGEKGGHIIHGNQFKSNHLDVQASAPPASFYNDWKNNAWDNYQGFDENADGFGDTPYELYAWSDRLWVDVPVTQFFRGTPVLSVLDFLERLTGFSDPDLMLRDSEPKKF